HSTFCRIAPRRGLSFRGHSPTTARALTPATLLVHGGPGPRCGLCRIDAARFVALLDFLGLAPLRRAVATFVSTWHRVTSSLDWRHGSAGVAPQSIGPLRRRLSSKIQNQRKPLIQKANRLKLKW